MDRILITGGAGFIASHLIEHFLKSTDSEIVALDRLDYSSNGFNRLRDVKCFNSKRALILNNDLTNPISMGLEKEISNVTYILHLGAQTHVDRSIDDPMPFVMSNVVGTTNILNFARKCPQLKKLVYFSTDEVYGPAPDGVNYKEWDRYNSGNPYSASKAGGEEMALAFFNTYKLPVVITHTMNVYGERQHPEKFIPMCINKILAGEKILIHGYPDKRRAGSRFYIHARNVSNAIHFLMKEGQPGDKYNIVGEREIDNLGLAMQISRIIGKPANCEIVDFHSSRPGHDLRYALDGSKMKSLGWEVPVNFDKSLEKVVKWYLQNTKWLKY